MAISTPYWESRPSEALGPEMTSADAMRIGSPAATSTQPMASIHSKASGATVPGASGASVAGGSVAGAGPQAANTRLATVRSPNKPNTFLDILTPPKNLQVELSSMEVKKRLWANSFRDTSPPFD